MSIRRNSGLAAALMIGAVGMFTPQTPRDYIGESEALPEIGPRRRRGKGKGMSGAGRTGGAWTDPGIVYKIAYRKQRGRDRTRHANRLNIRKRRTA